jgi:RNA polymerase sigma factor for flagellar operon FliA
VVAGANRRRNFAKFSAIKLGLAVTIRSWRRFFFPVSTTMSASYHDDEHQELWVKYHAGDRAAYEALVEAYLPMVKITVGRLAMNVPTFVDREDLYSAGCLGLLSAVEKYDATREAKFSTYALTRIRGAIIDELRSHDALGRITRDRVNRIDAAEQNLSNHGAEVTDETLAQAAGLTMEEYWDAESGRQATKLVSLDAKVRGGDGETTFAEVIRGRDDSPSQQLETVELIETIYKMLDEKEQLLVVLYYNEGLTLKEIGRVMQVTESRVCQLHSAMVAKIRRRLQQEGIYA